MVLLYKVIGKKKFKALDKNNWGHFKDGIFIGIGWAIGVTIGFVIISTILLFALRGLGGLPLVGRFFASIVEATQEQLIRRTPFIPQ